MVSSVVALSASFIVIGIMSGLSSVAVWSGIVWMVGASLMLFAVRVSVCSACKLPSVTVNLTLIGPPVSCCVGVNVKFPFVFSVNLVSLLVYVSSVVVLSSSVAIIS